MGTETRGEIQRQLHIHYLIMSWQSYVDDQLISTKLIKDAVIAGHDGNIWASSAGFSVTAAELKVILDRYTNTEQLAMNGLMVGGTKYMFLSANDRVIRGKKGQAGVHCIKTGQALIVCVYEEPVVPEQAATVTEKLGEYLSRWDTNPSHWRTLAQRLQPRHCSVCSLQSVKKHFLCFSKI